MKPARGPAEQSASGTLATQGFNLINVWATGHAESRTYAATGRTRGRSGAIPYGR
jgi:hypothetical protein